MDGVIGFQDIIKKSVLELGEFGNISLLDIFVGLSITFFISLFIFYIYMITFEGVVYSHSFNSTLVLLALITSVIIMTISSNIVLSLGMVGALSIVRFRAAIKDPKDIAFIFWAISVGIASGAKIYSIAIGGSLLIGMVMVILSKKTTSYSTYLLIIKYSKNSYQDILPILKKLNCLLKSKTVINDNVESIFELRKVGDNTSFLELMTEIKGVESATLVKYNGDYSE